MWLLFALLCAFFSGTSNCLAKLAMRHSDEYVVGWLRTILAIPFFLLLLFCIKIPRLDNIFFLTVILLLPLDMFAYILYLKAIRISPLSLTAPFMALTPLFSVATGALILKEYPTTGGIAGICCIVLGTYLLNIDTFREGALEPVRAILRERGSRYMILVAIIFSITVVLGKVAIRHSGPLFFGAFYFPLFALALVPVLYFRYRQGALQVRFTARDIPLYLALGIVFTLVISTHMLALSLTQASYMIAIKRTSIFFTLLYGGLVFKEKKIGTRLVASTVMFLGVVLILFAGSHSP